MFKISQLSNDLSRRDSRTAQRDLRSGACLGFKIDKSDGRLSEPQLQSLIVILQTIGTRAVAYFAVELCAVKLGPSCSRRWQSLRGVPLLARIPIFSMMDLPDP